MVIDELHIKNFQSHKETHLKFSAGLNVIVGQSDSGKSAILRALGWVVWNRPTGVAFRSHWADKDHVEVELKLIDGTSIKRVRGTNTNRYILNGSTFNAIGNDVPEEIRKATGIEEVNFQRQLDAPYLLALSPGEVARHFNQMAGLEVIDGTLYWVQKEVKNTEQKVETLRERKAELEQELAQFEFVDELVGWVDGLELLHQQSTALVKNTQELTAKIQRIKELEEVLTVHRKVVRAENQVEDIEKFIQEAEQIEEQSQALEDLIKRYEEVETKKNRLGKIVGARQVVHETVGLVERLQDIEGRVQELQDFIEKVKWAEASLTEATGNLQGLELAFAESFPETCPLCGQSVEEVRV